MKSLINETLVKNHEETVDANLAKLEAEVNANTAVMNSDDRSLYGKGGGDAARLLVADIFALAKNQPQLRSPMLDWDVLENELQASNTVAGWIQRLESVTYKLKSNKMLLDYDCYMAALDQYNHLEYLTRNGVQGASEAHRQIKSHFKRSKSDKTETPEK